MSELNRFSRFELLVGHEKINQLSREKVAIFGLGGVGSYAVEALARAGIGWFILADHDDICLTNTNRQLHALMGNYGKAKVDVMAERIKAINPDAAVVCWKQFVDSENIEAILHGRVSYVIDAVDTVTTKVAMIQYCVEHEIPIISCMGTGNKFDPSALRVDDISKTHTCPLAKAVRKLLRERNITHGVKVVFSTEPPVAHREDIPTCHTGCICPNRDKNPYACTHKKQIPGSTSYLPPIAGLMMAGTVIRDLLAKEETPF